MAHITRPFVLLMKSDISEPKQPPPPPEPTLGQALRQQERDARRRAAYEREFPYDKPTQSDERLSRRSPTVSGGLPSLGKRRR